MRKLFNIKISEFDLPALFRKINETKIGENSEHGTYDVELSDQKLKGSFWTREQIVILNETDIYTSAEPITITKVNRFTFSLQNIQKSEYLLNIESSSRSIKPLVKYLQDITEAKIFISQIEINLTELANYFQFSKIPLIKITNAYASNQTINNSEKITFSIYSQGNAITSAQTIIKKENLLFDRVRIQASHQGQNIILDIKSNCLYSISAEKSEMENKLIAYVLKTQAE